MATRKKQALLLTHRGFTVGELLVTTSVIAILGAMAVPGFNSQWRAHKLNAAATKVLGELVWAKTKAVQENNQFIVSFPSNTSLKILDDDDNNGSENVGVEWTKTLSFNDEYPGVTLSMGEGDPNPAFSPRGTTGGETIITVTNSSDTKTVRVRIAGSVKID